ncbi:MAG TPA: hypothetical protein VI277_07555 [Candidatus Limnocylindria bacterium]
MTRRADASLLRRMLAVLAILSLAAASVALLAPALVSASGSGSPDACITAHDPDSDDLGQSENLITYTAPSSYTITGVCIKSGDNMFDGNKHSGVLGNGTYEDGCYEVSGVGTNSVTVTRLGEGPYCQGLSHVDIVKVKNQSQSASHRASQPASQPASHKASEPASQPASHSASQSASEAASEPASQAASQLASEPASQAASQSANSEPSEDTLGGNPTPGGEVPDTAVGGFNQIPATLLSLVFLAALGGMVYLRLARERER